MELFGGTSAVLKADGGGATAPLVSAFGGKITTYRRLAESMLEKIEGFLGKRGKPWTASAPGGDFPATGFKAEVGTLQADFPFLESRLARRLVRLYSTRARTLLGTASSYADPGRDFGGDLYEAEVRYLVGHEWAQTAEDVL